MDEAANAKYRNPLTLDNYIRELTSDKSHDYYVLLDEIQKVEEIKNPYLPKESKEKIGFVDVLLGIMKLPKGGMLAAVEFAVPLGETAQSFAKRSGRFEPQVAF